MHLDQPLSDKEFDSLDQFLLSGRCPEDAMTMDMLHGYLTAIAIGPETVLPAEWLPRVWGEDPQQGPKFTTPKEEERIVNLIMRFMNEILITFEVAPKDYEPLFVEREHEGEMLIDAESWCWGFQEGLELRADAWSVLYDSDQADLMRPIDLLGADEIEEADLPLVEDPVSAHKLALEVEANVPLIHRFWLPRRKAPVETVKRDEPKVGRNDDCPCGSGRKYKKCHGAEN
ncbi:UPF0149 family protein [Massilia arenosa]|uniref:UPF0149 family protein n=1 Tax=Zemynaea arenosa TaxID=2561931 RepID=A0A4Y9SI77_9BURK|nr:UPF0149 family protein [Massilia arenosa]TFW21348.1 UPF0149 family protein [Massilia arenosa]